MNKLKGKNAVITGCNRGIGKAILEIFSEEGSNIWALTRSRSDENMQEWKRLEENYNCWIEHIPFDLGVEQSVKDAIRQITKEKRTVDILVNNAGVPHSGLLSLTSMKDVRDIMEKDFIKPMMLVQGLSKQMIRQKSGVIINIISIGGIETYDGFFAYGSAKAALAWATQSVSKELGRYGIRMNGVAPGLTETQLGIGMHTQQQIEETIKLCTIHRMAQPSEIAKAVLFLASDDAAFITGQILRVDGGR